MVEAVYEVEHLWGQLSVQTGSLISILAVA
jgi:hypothetical protein